MQAGGRCFSNENKRSSAEEFDDLIEEQAGGLLHWFVINWIVVTYSSNAFGKKVEREPISRTHVYVKEPKEINYFHTAVQ